MLGLTGLHDRELCQTLPVLSASGRAAGMWNGVPVAVKIVPSFKLASADLALQESVLGSTISHPNVVRPGLGLGLA